MSLCTHSLLGADPSLNGGFDLTSVALFLLQLQLHGYARCFPTAFSLDILNLRGLFFDHVLPVSNEDNWSWYFTRKHDKCLCANWTWSDTLPFHHKHLVTVACAFIIFRLIHYVLLTGKKGDSPSQGAYHCEHCTSSLAKDSSLLTLLYCCASQSSVIIFHFQSILKTMVLITKFTDE